MTYRIMFIDLQLQIAADANNQLSTPFNMNNSSMEDVQVILDYIYTGQLFSALELNARGATRQGVLQVARILGLGVPVLRNALQQV